jgi:hypothetical protein
MDGPIERVPPQVKILPPREREGGGRRQHFSVEGEPAACHEEEPASAPVDQRPLGHAAPEEAGKRLDVTA